MTSPILFAGQEDISFVAIGSGIYAAATNFQWSPNTTANSFRSGYARYSMAYNLPLNLVAPNFAYLRTASAFTSSTFWTSSRFNVNALGVTGAQPTTHLMRWADSNGVVRLRISTSQTNPPACTYIVEKINAAGTVTQIGSTSTGNIGSGISLLVPDKIDVYINYNTSGQFFVYLNGLQTFAFSGDITTDGQTSLSYFDVGMWSVTSVTSLISWSEIIVSTRDTRNMSLVTQTATATGNTDTFTSGSTSNINGNSVNYSSPDFSSTAAQIQEYKITPNIPTGNFSVLSVVQHGIFTLGSNGPQHIQFMVRTGSIDYNSTTLSPTLAWGLLTYNWDLNPNTVVSWASTDLAASSTSFNFGYQSVT